MQNSDKMLQYLKANVNIDWYSVQQDMDKKERENYLALHTYNVWQGSNGKWYTYLPEKEGRKQVKRTTEAKLQDAIVDYYKSQKEEPTIGSVYYDWINQKIEDKEISRGTFDRYSNDYKRFFADKEIASRKIASVTEDDLVLFIRQTIIGHKLTHKAYSNFRTLVLGIFKFAKQKKYTTISISTFIQDLALPKTIFAKVIRNKEDQIYLEDEIPKAVEYLKSNPTIVNLGLLLAFQTGLRCGELAALKPTDIVGKAIHVRRQEIKYKDEVTQKTIPEIKAYPKTDCGNRYVIITDNALETIEMVKKLNPTGEFLFEANGIRLKYYNYNNGISHMCKALNITQKSMHKIRRTYGTTLIDEGVAESIIAQQMGHSDISTTRAFYYFSNKTRKTQESQIEKALSF
ncbi:site-specific integrase [Clostridium sp. YIM B02500]|uniref:tyrosine-type recombinase/integrase n=1 Tax=Clostridium sp. YIM B02500 TaxID=2910681 RepID=UPI001EED03B0|nr:site-specific integrase [Clostridium sp. YIM B02500]